MKEKYLEVLKEAAEVGLVDEDDQASREAFRERVADKMVSIQKTYLDSAVSDIRDLFDLVFLAEEIVAYIAASAIVQKEKGRQEYLALLKEAAEVGVFETMDRKELRAEVERRAEELKKLPMNRLATYQQACLKALDDIVQEHGG